MGGAGEDERGNGSGEIAVQENTPHQYRARRLAGGATLQQAYLVPCGDPRGGGGRFLDSWVRDR